MIPDPYPSTPRSRAAWILRRRPRRAVVDPLKPCAVLVETERTEDGELVEVATILLTSRECACRCVMCDLWKHTLTEPTPLGAIPAQLDHALARLEADAKVSRPRHIKLYNSGSFFDRRAVPPADYPAIAQRLRGFERVIVECHPGLVGPAVLGFRDLLAAARGGAGGAMAQLEVALGLETAHPEVLAKLNKAMRLADFTRAAEFLRGRGVAVRAFILVQPPFLPEPEALPWAQISLEFAFDAGASVTSLIPTRLGNGALEELARQGEFTPPRLATLEAAAAHGIGLRRGRVLADLWDLEQLSTCPACFGARAARLLEMNLRQVVPPEIACPSCGHRVSAGGQ